MRRRYKKWPSSLLFLILFGIGLGYAFLNSNLNISGVTGLLNSTWNIYWDNIVFSENNVTDVTTPATISSNKTEVSFNVNFSKPGDTYEFTVDAVNDGSVDGMVDSFTNKVYTVNGVTEKELPEYLEFTVSYSDGTVIHENDLLAAHERETYKVRVHYKEDIDSTQLPSTADNYLFKFSITYAQADGNAKEVGQFTLYNVLKRAAEEGTYAREYTGEHHDSFTEEPSKKIYHWYGNNDTNGTTIQDKNNVIFANHCWQMIRTTDTGGVKIIYNGEVEDGKCLDYRKGLLGYSSYTNYKTLLTSYYYGSSFEYDNTSKTFKISGEISTGEIKKEQYTCLSSNSDETCSELYYVTSYYSASTPTTLRIIPQSYIEQSIGYLPINKNSSSPNSVGYMTNDDTISSYSKTMYNSDDGFVQTSPMKAESRYSYYYGTDIEYYNRKYKITNNVSPYNVIMDWSSTKSENEKFINMYTCSSQSSSFIWFDDLRVQAGRVCSTVKYVLDVSNDMIIYQPLNGYKQQTTPNQDIILSNKIIDNGDGTYTLDPSGKVSVSRLTWYQDYANYNHYYYCSDYISTTCQANQMYYLTSVKKSGYQSYININNSYKYANSFSYEDGKYILDDKKSVSFWNYNDSTNRQKLNNNHYTCWNNSGECTTLSYIYYADDNNLYYINLNNGESIDEIIDSMFNNNENDSILKIGLEAWYKKFMIDYSDYFEDTIFCNNRSVTNLGGWNPNGGKLDTYLTFQEENSKDLSCKNIIDSFSVSNNKAKLKYKVGLITLEELNLLNNSNIYTNTSWFWTNTPSYINNNLYAYSYSLDSNGNKAPSSTDSFYSIKPVVSLANKTKYISGDGSKANPYVVES